MSEQDSQTTINLDIVCAEVGKKLADEINDEKIINDALTVLEQHGLYAMFLYIHARYEKEGKPFINTCLKFLQEVLGTQPSDEYFETTKKLATDLNNLLFACELMRNALCYARYHIKTKGE